MDILNILIAAAVVLILVICYYKFIRKNDSSQYLNDIKDGGGTHFVYQNFTTKPVAGNLYIWPAGWTHMHHGVNAPKEVKYILTGWVNYTDN